MKITPFRKAAGGVFARRARRAGAARFGIMAAGAAAAFLGGWTLLSFLTARRTEKPRYRVVEKKKDYEVREYDPYIVAETDVKGGYGEALRKGFRTLFHYIAGGNTRLNRLAMTAPVVAGSEKIPMTAPVIERKTGEEVRTVGFVMPSRYNLETLPEPDDPSIRLRQLPHRKMAALRFSGFATPGRVEHKKKELLTDLERDRVQPVSGPEYAGYTPPSTIPFLMRNEVLVEVK